jgi:hypothetical protein
MTHGTGQRETKTQDGATHTNRVYFAENFYGDVTSLRVQAMLTRNARKYTN